MSASRYTFLFCLFAFVVGACGKSLTVAEREEQERQRNPSTIKKKNNTDKEAFVPPMIWLMPVSAASFGLGVLVRPSWAPATYGGGADPCAYDPLVPAWVNWNHPQRPAIQARMVARNNAISRVDMWAALGPYVNNLHTPGYGWNPPADNNKKQAFYIALAQVDYVNGNPIYSGTTYDPVADLADNDQLDRWPEGVRPAQMCVGIKRLNTE